MPVTDVQQDLDHMTLTHHRARFAPVFELLREQGRIKNIPTEIFYFQLTSGGTAPFGQIGLVSLMAPKLASPDDNQVRLYAENVADMLLNGLSLLEINRG